MRAVAGLALLGAEYDGARGYAHHRRTKGTISLQQHLKRGFAVQSLIGKPFLVVVIAAAILGFGCEYDVAVGLPAAMLLRIAP